MQVNVKKLIDKYTLLLFDCYLEHGGNMMRRKRVWARPVGFYGWLETRAFANRAGYPLRALCEALRDHAPELDRQLEAYLRERGVKLTIPPLSRLVRYTNAKQRHRAAMDRRLGRLEQARSENASASAAGPGSGVVERTQASEIDKMSSPFDPPY